MKKLLHRITFILFLIILLVCPFIELNAVPAYPYPFTYTQPDGKLVQIKLMGDEKVHWAETMDGYTLLSNGKDGWEYARLDDKGNLVCSGILAKDPQGRAGKDNDFLLKTPKKLTFSSSQSSLLKSIWETQHAQNIASKFEPNGNKHLVLIMIGFPDLAFTKTHEDFDGLMNQIGYNLNGATGSVKDFFLETSYNQFNLTTTVAGPYTAAHNLAYYGADNGSDKDEFVGELISEAVTLANPDVNYADFDNDGDGSVDGVYVVYAGYSQASGAPSYTIWPHASSIPMLTFDGKTISKYSCSNELLGTSGTNMTTIGVICHEFGHVCGAKDYYDTDYATDGQYDGTQNWDVMATGVYNGSPSGSRPPHLNPFEKIRFSWAIPILVSSDASLQLADITTNPVIYRYNTTTSNEYFLMENRQQTGFNTAVPGHGLMIYHVDGNFIATAGNAIDANSHQGMFPMAANSTSANGIMVAPSTIRTAGCSWPGTGNVTTFSDVTTPNSLSWAGNPTNAALTNIAENAGVITLCFISCPSINPVFNFAATAASGTQVDLSWIKNAADNDVIVATNSINTFGDPINGTSYNIGDGIAGGGTIIYKGSASDFSHTGLSPLTTYYYNAWSMTSNPDYSSGSSANVQTLCASVISLPVSEGFEGGLIPDCWSQETIEGTSPWEIKTAGTNSHPASPYTGTYLVRCRTTTLNAADITKLISPPIDLSGSTSPVLKFWHTQDTSTPFICQDILRIYYRTSASASWILLTTYNTTIASWTLESVSLPNPSASYFIAFEATVNGGSGICLDDIYIRNEDCEYGSWLGTVSNDWFTSGNWCGPVPNASSDVIIPSGTPNSPSINASGALCRNITINNGATLSMSAATAYTLSVSGNWTNNGSFTAGIGTVKFNGTNDLQTISGSSTTTFNILQVSKGALSKILEVTSLIAFPGSPSTNPLVVTSGTFKLSSASAINFSTNQFDISGGLWNNGGTINSTSNNCVVYGLFKNSAGISNIQRLYYYTGSTITIEGGTVNISAQVRPFTAVTSTTAFNQAGGSLNFSVAATSSSASPFEITSGSTFTMSNGTIVIQKNSSSNSNDYYNLATTNNVTGGIIQIGNSSTTGSPTIRINSYAPIYNLVVNSTGTPKAQLVTNNLTVKNDVTISTGTTLDANNRNINVGGHWTNNGTFTPGTGTATFDGTTAQQNIGGSTATSFNNMTLTNAYGVSLSGSVNTTITNVLTLTNGIITTGSNKVIIPSTGSVSRTSGHIFGFLQKNIATGSSISRTFEIGNAAISGYSPFSITIGSVSTAGDITAKVVTGDHPNIASSSLSSGLSINRYWTITNSAVVFDNYTGTFTYLASDLDATANTNNLICGNYSASVWSYPTIGTRTTTSTEITGNTAFSDFILAETAVVKSSITSGGNWSSPSTWDPTGVPIFTDNVIITNPGTVIVDVNNAACNDMAIQSGGVLRVNPSMAITVNGQLTNSAGTAGLIIKADALGSGSLIHYSDDVSATVERYVPANTIAYVSPPVSGATRILFAGSVNNKLYQYNAVSGSWDLITIDATPLEIMRGYVSKYATDKTLSFTGILNNGSHLAGLASHVSLVNGGVYGWNLVGNPYASALDVGTTNNPVSGWTFGTDIQNFVSIRKNDGNVAYWSKAGDGLGNNGGTRYIAPTQAYWINLNGSSSVGFGTTNISRVHNSQNILKSQLPNEIFRLSAWYKSHSDETTIGFFPEGLESYDSYDAEKMFINDTNFAMVYTLSSEGSRLAINGLNPLQGDRSVALGFECLKTGTYSFYANLNDLDPMVSVRLEDMLEGNTQDLRTNPEYSFSSPAVNTTSRFILHFGTPKVTGQVVYDNPQYPSVIQGATVRLLSSSGAELATTSTDSNGHYKFDFVPQGSKLIVSSSHPGGGWNAIDAQYVMRYFTGLMTFDYLSLKAADVNGNGYINSVDALTIMKRFVGSISSFIPGEWVFEELQTNILTPGSTKNIKIKGLHFGDVNKSYQP